MAEPTSPAASTPPVEDPVPPSASLAPSPSLDDWPAQATDAVVKVVDAVRDKTTGPAVNAAHATKYGIVVFFMVAVLGPLLLIMLFRLTEVALQGIGRLFNLDWLSEPMWIVYVFYGSIFSVIGLWLWRKANKPAKA